MQHVDGLNYEFTDKRVATRITLPIIHLYSGHKLNAIGDDRLALSHSWFSKSDPKLIRKLANNTVNFFRHKCDAPAICRFWSAPSAFKDALRRKSFQSPQSFVPHNARAVNAYRHCYALAYLINIFPNPKIVSYFKSTVFSLIMMLLLPQLWFNGYGAAGCAADKRYGCICQAAVCVSCCISGLKM